ncbi:tripartite tricarboxylate transporter substrate binding protein [Alkalicoccobacillus murimartini]|uniref:Tripartite-type tricarboxylate transporter receptor subunit TctC n=1 Tax=Alkalicoccobacillus murimartini TaxID=171685 RepID=A0ABT9YH01_9BACI|nr:tripartite tricarboxylate transporter substrate binding protein [Alkalicoccobacillus murimartini]MDQ0206878.1 tripartite-type tricarboxylate transporter receptor subunit TctC [Alkalicoccobacillus murimartini]
MRKKGKMAAVGMVLLFLAACSSSEGKQATVTDIEAYPNQTIEIYVPASPGGQTDTAARVMAKHLPKYLGANIVIVNQATAGGALAFENVRSSDKTGYNLLFHHQALHTGHAVRQLEHNTNELTAIGTYSSVNQVFVVSANSPFDTLDDLVEFAKENPNEVIYGSQIGGTTHFMGELLGIETDTDIKILDVGSESDRMTGLLGGQIDLAVTGVGNVLSYIESGDFKALGVLSEERDELAPELETTVEQGYDVQFPIVHSLYGPPDMPEEIVQMWNEATEKLAEDEAYNEELQKTFQQHTLMDAEETTVFSQEEMEKAQLIADELFSDIQ